MPIQSIPIGVVANLVQNQIYALPAATVMMFTDSAATFQQSTTSAFTANIPVVLTNGQAQLSGGFIRCTTANANVLLKQE